MENHPVSPTQLVKSVLANRRLIGALAARELAIRYKGSLLGIAWTLVQPIFMLAIYTFVFSAIFKARWPGGTGSKTEFALVLFAGLMVFNVFSEVFNRAPRLVIENSNYVKKVVFPLEILSCVSVITALFNLLINLTVWLIFHLVTIGLPPASALLFPLAIVPLVMFLAGTSWFLSALGVFIRDTAQITPILTTAVMFLTPIFFPVDAIPPAFRPLLSANPLAPIVDQVRDSLIWGKGLHASTYAYSLGISLVVMFAGFAFYQKTRKGFADVL